MARRPRLYLPGCPLHIIQRGNNRDACFRDDSDYKAYLHFMRESATQYEVSIHAYVLMTNHVHILATPLIEESVSRMMNYMDGHSTKKSIFSFSNFRRLIESGC